MFAHAQLKCYIIVVTLALVLQLLNVVQIYSMQWSIHAIRFNFGSLSDRLATCFITVLMHIYL